MERDTRRVAIACQGGGSHTAFTAGVLSRLLPDLPEDVEIVALSGTSGGAMCAALGWYGLVHDDHEPDELLRSFWAELAAESPTHRTANDWLQWGLGMRRWGIPLPEVSPYHNPAARWGQRELERVLEAHVDFEAIPGLLADDDSHLALLISAIDVKSGELRLFREDELSPGALLASAAEPDLFEAVEVDGRHYWDGLFTKNPPIEAFVTTEDFPDPDEVWLVKINPNERDRAPQSLHGIFNRRNELSGNIAMNAEIRFVETVNRWVEAGYLPDRYTHTEIRTIPLDRQLDWRTKLDRNPEFLTGLIEDGVEAAETFLDE